MFQPLHAEQQAVKSLTILVPSVVPVQIDECAGQEGQATLFSLGSNVRLQRKEDCLSILGGHFPVPRLFVTGASEPSNPDVSAFEYVKQFLQHGQGRINYGDLHYVCHPRVRAGFVKRNAALALHNTRRPCQVSDSHMTNVAHVRCVTK